MTPLTLFVSVLLYMAAILCPGVKPNETETSKFQEISKDIQESSKQSTQKEHSQL